MDILIDFDGTCTTHSFPHVGGDIGSVPVLKKLVENGHRLILFTMRSDCKNNKGASEEFPHISNGMFLQDAVDWFKDNEIPLFGIQCNPEQHSWTTSPKAYGQMMIDDSALGCPLKFDDRISTRPFVDWTAVEEILKKQNII